MLRASIFLVSHSPFFSPPFLSHPPILLAVEMKAFVRFSEKERDHERVEDEVWSLSNRNGINERDGKTKTS